MNQQPAKFRHKRDWPVLDEQDWRGAFEQILTHRLEENTKSNYATGQNAWNHFRNLYNIPDPIPTLETLSRFLVQLTYAHYRYSSIRTYLSGIRNWMVEIRYGDYWKNLVEDITIKNMLEGIRKIDGKLHGGTIRKPPMRVEDICRIIRRLNWEDYDEILFATITVFGFYGLCRLGELVWPSTKRYQSYGKIILRSCVSIAEDGTHATCTLPYMKNARFYEGSRVWLIRQDNLTDPVNFLRRYLLLRDAIHGAMAPLFIRRNGQIPERAWYIARLKVHLGKSYSGHSLRSGGANPPGIGRMG